MAFVRVSLRGGKSPEYKRALLDGIYQALLDAFEIPEDDRFSMIHEHAEDEFDFGADYLGIHRSEDLVFVQVTANNSRSLDTKKHFYRRLSDVLAERPGLRREDLFISLVEVDKANWSFGLGECQYA